MEFNGDGDRMNPMYNVINVKKGEQQAVVGRYSAALVGLAFQYNTVDTVLNLRVIRLKAHNSHPLTSVVSNVSSKLLD